MIISLFIICHAATAISYLFFLFLLIIFIIIVFVFNKLTSSNYKFPRDNFLSEPFSLSFTLTLYIFFSFLFSQRVLYKYTNYNNVNCKGIIKLKTGDYKNSNQRVKKNEEMNEQKEETLTHIFKHLFLPQFSIIRKKKEKLC